MDKVDEDIFMDDMLEEETNRYEPSKKKKRSLTTPENLFIVIVKDGPRCHFCGLPCEGNLIHNNEATHLNCLNIQDGANRIQLDLLNNNEIKTLLL